MEGLEFDQIGEMERARYYQLLEKWKGIKLLVQMASLWLFSIIDGELWKEMS